MNKNRGGRAARKNLETSFLEAYDLYAAALLRHIYFRVSDQEVAHDLLAETFTKTWQYLRGGGEIKRNLKSLLYKVADNLIIDHYRSRNRAVSLEAMPDAANVAVEQKGREKMDDEIASSQILKEHLARLPEDHRKILIYRYLDELEIGEIKDLTGKSPAAIYTTIHRALKALKVQIEGNEK